MVWGVSNIRENMGVGSRKTYWDVQKCVFNTQFDQPSTSKYSLRRKDAKTYDVILLGVQNGAECL